LPIRVLNGKPGYINLLDAFNGWQLVRELKEAAGLPAAASFKHVSPAGAAVGLPLSEILRRIYRVEEYPLSPLACAYARARGADRMSSFGDFISLSDVCDKETAALIAREVSDGIIAPGYDDEALAILKGKRKGGYTVVEVDPTYKPEDIERKTVFGVEFEQGRNDIVLGKELLTNIPTANKTIPAESQRDLLIALITLKYTQSNSVCFVKEGQAIGIGAGQQSRIHCTRLAGDKADRWYLRQHPQVLALPFKPGLSRPDRDNVTDVYVSGDTRELFNGDGWKQYLTEKPEAFPADVREDWLTGLTEVALGSDAFFPFEDNIRRAYASGVRYIAQPGGSIRDKQVVEACDAFGMAMVFTGVRLFHH
jgi:AICAR transformylase/IMP cyclohydrolase PurH